MSIDWELDLNKKIGPNDRILVVNPLNTDWSYQLTSEVALRARKLNPNVIWVNVSDRTPKKYHQNSVDFLPRWRYFSPERRVSKALQGYGVQTNSAFVKVNPAGKSHCFKDIQEVKNANYKGMNIGAMIYSAISFAFRSTSFSFYEIEDHLAYYMNQVEAIETKLIEVFVDFQPTLVLTINDRLLGSAIALSMASGKGLKKGVVYWGWSSETIQDYENSLYDAQEWRNQIQRYWDSLNAEKPLRKSIIDNLISDAQLPSQDSQTFIQNQKKGKSISKARPTCVFYAQSEYEHSGFLVDTPDNRFKNQYEAFERLQEVCKEINYDLYVKFHPLRPGSKDTGLSSRYVREWSEIEFNESVKVIPNDSDIDTYQLLSDADVNVLWSGTTGPQAILKGNKVLVLGNPPWLNLGWGIHAWTKDQIRTQLLRGVSTLDPEVLAPWFSFISCYGAPVEYSSLKPGRLSILGNTVIKDSLFYRAGQKFKSTVGL